LVTYFNISFCKTNDKKGKKRKEKVFHFRMFPQEKKNENAVPFLIFSFS